MKRVCAWCGRALDQPERREDVQVTHGVCQDCRSKFFASSKATKAGTLEDVGDHRSGSVDYPCSACSSSIHLFQANAVRTRRTEVVRMAEKSRKKRGKKKKPAPKKQAKPFPLSLMTWDEAMDALLADKPAQEPKKKSP